MTEKQIGCDNCYYLFFDEKAYPCSLCVRGIERTDQWRPNKKTKDGQTDLLITEYPEEGEVILIGRDKTEAVVMAYDVYKELTEPQTSKIIEAYSRGFKDGANAVKSIPQTETEAD